MSYSLLILAVCTRVFALRVFGQALAVFRAPLYSPLGAKGRKVGSIWGKPG